MLSNQVKNKLCNDCVSYFTYFVKYTFQAYKNHLISLLTSTDGSKCRIILIDTGRD